MHVLDRLCGVSTAYADSESVLSARAWRVQETHAMRGGALRAARAVSPRAVPGRSGHVDAEEGVQTLRSEMQTHG